MSNRSADSRPPSSPPPRAPLRVDTDLSVTVDGTPVDVRSTGDRLFVEFPSVLTAARIARKSPNVYSRDLHEMLTTTALTVELRARARTLAVVGADARPGPLSRRLGVDPVELRVGGVVGAAVQELATGLRRVRRRLTGW